jgi:predicted transcriptional regulator
MYTPQRYAILEAIASNVLEIINQLEAEELIERKIKGFIFKKEVYELTYKGKIYS